MTIGRVRLVVRGEIRVPGDKSVSHRALMFGSLASGRSSVRGILQSADTAPERQRHLTEGRTRLERDVRTRKRKRIAL